MNVDDMRQELQDAIGAHGAWNLRLHTAARVGGEALSVQDICDDNRCRFGQWLQRVPASAKGADNLPEIRRLHANFHRAAGHVAQLIKAGQLQKGLAALTAGPFVETSTALSMTLDSWRQSL